MKVAKIMKAAGYRCKRSDSSDGYVRYLVHRPDGSPVVWWVTHHSAPVAWAESYEVERQAGRLAEAT